MVNETQVAGWLRKAVETAYERVDDVDILLGNLATFVAGAVEVVKQGLVEADAALADFDKTEEVNLGADLADTHDREDEGKPEFTVEDKLAVIRQAADDKFGIDNHLWWVVQVNSNNRASIAAAYDDLVNGTLFA